MNCGLFNLISTVLERKTLSVGTLSTTDVYNSHYTGGNTAYK